MDSDSVATLSPALSLLRVVGSALIALTIPFVLVCGSVRYVTLDHAFYLKEFERNRVGLVTGLSDPQLSAVATAFIEYFQSGPRPLDVRVDGPDGLRPLFSQREIEHMEDVQKLMALFFGGWFLALGLLAVGSAALLFPDPSTGVRWLLRAAAAGSGLTLLLVGGLSLAALFDFQQLFLRFHFLSFSNDLWLLDPRKDRLIQLYPQGFFFDAAIRVGMHTIGFALAILVPAVITLRQLR